MELQSYTKRNIKLRNAEHIESIGDEVIQNMVSNSYVWPISQWHISVTICQYVPNISINLQTKHVDQIQVQGAWSLNAINKGLPENYKRKTAWIPNYCVERMTVSRFSAGASGHTCRMTGARWTVWWNQDIILLQIMWPVTCKILIPWS